MKMICYILDLTMPKRIVQIEKKTKNLINNGTSSSVCLSVNSCRTCNHSKKRNGSLHEMSTHLRQFRKKHEKILRADEKFRNINFKMST